MLGTVWWVRKMNSSYCGKILADQHWAVYHYFGMVDFQTNPCGQIEKILNSPLNTEILVLAVTGFYSYFLWTNWLLFVMLAGINGRNKWSMMILKKMKLISRNWKDTTLNSMSFLVTFVWTFGLFKADKHATYAAVFFSATTGSSASTASATGYAHFSWYNAIKALIFLTNKTKTFQWNSVLGYKEVTCFIATSRFYYLLKFIWASGTINFFMLFWLFLASWWLGCLLCNSITEKGKGPHLLELLTVPAQEIQLVLHQTLNHQLHLLILLVTELLWRVICRMLVACQKV